MLIVLKILLALFLLILVLLLWILIAPFVISINSKQQIMEFKLLSIGKINAFWDEKGIGIKIRVFGFTRHVYVDPFRRKSKTKEKEKKKKEKSKQRYKWTTIKRKIKRVLHTFEMKKLRLKLDTDNYYRNAFLYPVFYLITQNQLLGNKRDKGNYNLSMNFHGENEIEIILRNRLIRIVIAILF